MPPKMQWTFIRRFANKIKIDLDNLKPPVQPNKLFGPSWEEWIYQRDGYNQYGLMRDDLYHETPVVKEALKRLPQHIQDERVFRIVRAGYLCLRKEVLPKEQWMTLEKDVQYLTPYVEQVKKEIKEKEDWDKD